MTLETCKKRHCFRGSLGHFLGKGFTRAVMCCMLQDAENVSFVLSNNFGCGTDVNDHDTQFFTCAKGKSKKLSCREMCFGISHLRTGDAPALPKSMVATRASTTNRENVQYLLFFSIVILLDAHRKDGTVILFRKIQWSLRRQWNGSNPASHIVRVNLPPQAFGGSDSRVTN